MGNITLALPNDLQEQMKQFSEVKWSEVARKAIQQRVQTLQLAERLAQKSELTEQDAKELSDSIKRAATKRFFDERSS